MKATNCALSPSADTSRRIVPVNHIKKSIRNRGKRRPPRADSGSSLRLRPPARGFRRFLDRLRSATHGHCQVRRPLLPLRAPRRPVFLTPRRHTSESTHRHGWPCPRRHQSPHRPTRARRERPPWRRGSAGGLPAGFAPRPLRTLCLPAANLRAKAAEPMPHRPWSRPRLRLPRGGTRRANSRAARSAFGNTSRQW